MSHRAATAISGHLDTRTAAIEVAEYLYDELKVPCHLLFVFGSFHHRAAFADAIDDLRRTLKPTVVLGVTTESVIGGGEEREGRAGLSALALHMPDVTLRPWKLTAETSPHPDDVSNLRTWTGAGPDSRGFVMFADPFTIAMQRWLPALSACAGAERLLPVCGGMASGASQPGHNVLALDGETTSAGAVGVTIAGEVRLDFIVSQGCRPIGDRLVVTRSEGNVVQELGGKPPMAILKEIALALPEPERALMNHGLLVGLVIDEYKERYGRGDFLIRNVTALDPKRGIMAVADRMRVGQTVQFHVRDAATATEDLDLLLDAQQLDVAPYAALLFTCNGRGTRLFAEPNHDLQQVRGRLGGIPVAGFFAAGEIGPVGQRSFLHGHTASIAVFREPEAATQSP